MIDLELELVSENPSWIAVLKAYQMAQEELAAQQAETAAKSAQAENFTSDSDVADESETSLSKKRVSRWVQRITKLPGIETEELSKIHGQLIAYDLLKCELAGRSDGMVYQLTASGKTTLGRFDDEAIGVDERSAA